MHRWRAVCLAMIVTASACESPEPAPPSGSPPSAPVRGGQLVLSSNTDIKTLQPVLSSDSASSGVWSLIYEELLRTDGVTGEAQPGLAERFSTSGDGRRMTYWLREGVTWSDGVPITGDDYRYALHAYARSRLTRSKSNFQDIVGWRDYVEGRDRVLRGVVIADAGRSIEVELSRSSCVAMRSLAIPPLPKHVFVKHWNDETNEVATSIDDSSFNMAPPVASGPFLFKEHRPGDFVALTRNERYYLGPPHLEGVVFKIFGNASAIRTALLTGEISMALVSHSDIEEVRRSGTGLQEYRATQSGYSFIGWNQKAARAPWLADKRVRQALSFALDLDTVLDKVLLGYGRRVFANTPPGSWAHDPTGLAPYPFDPQRARLLIQAAGGVMGADGVFRWSNGQTMHMRIETDVARETLVQVFQEQYRAVGISVEPVVTTFQALAGRVSKNPPDASIEGVLLNWSFSPDPAREFSNIWHSSAQGTGLNFVGFANADVDAALDRNRYGPDCSISARRAANHAIDRIVNDEAPYTFLFAQDNVTFRSARVVAPPPQPFANRVDIHTWWMRP